MNGPLGAGRVIADPAAYDAWYQTSRGRWIGETEYRLLRRLLAPRANESILDAGCGTGYFTHKFASDGHFVIGVDVDPVVVAHGRRSAGPSPSCAVADMKALPFPDHSFDCVVAVTSLCFVADPREAIRELLRVTRRQLVLGLLNRRSLLWQQKGRDGGKGGYAGARWLTADDATKLFGGLPVRKLRVTSAIALPNGGWLARFVERIWPNFLPYGGLLAISASPCERLSGSHRGTP